MSAVVPRSTESRTGKERNSSDIRLALPDVDSSGGVPALLSCCPVRASSDGAMIRPSAKEVAMRTLKAVVALVLGMAVYATLLAAADQKAEGKVGVVLVERIQDLHLTDEQETKIADIRKECRPKVQKEFKELTILVKEEMEKIQGVLTPEQRKKVAELKEERKEFREERLAERLAHLHELDLTEAEKAKFLEIRKEFRPQIEKAMKGLEGILSDEQKKAREEALKAGKKRKEVIAALKLTDAEKKKVEDVGKELRTIVREELTKMRDVLTEGQKEKLQEFKEERREHVRNRHAHIIANLKDLNLTDEQKEKIAAIRKDYRPKVHEAGNKLRATIREEVDMILADIKG
jgi:Spy/CpxP family protein refolding chaperone